MHRMQQAKTAIRATRQTKRQTPTMPGDCGKLADQEELEAGSAENNVWHLNKDSKEKSLLS